MDKQLLTELCALSGVSGHESVIRIYITNRLDASDAPHDVTVDAMGNILVHMIGKQPAPHKLLLDAHMDEVGVIITHIHDDGSLSFDTVGGIDKQVLFGHRVQIGSCSGIIGGKAIHHCSGDEKTTIPTAETMAIDIGAADRQEAERFVKLGSWGTFATGFCDRGDLFTGKAVDDRVGCALLLQLAQTQPLYDIWLSFSVQEEIGLRGAGVVGNAVRPDIAIAIDATTAADTVGSSRKNAVCHLGDGAVVSFADRATLYDPTLYQLIRSVGEECGIPTQTKNRVAGGNNAGAIQCAGNGTKMAAVSLPCRYIHSGACTGKWSDVEAMERLLAELIKRLPA